MAKKDNKASAKAAAKGAVKGAGSKATEKIIKDITNRYRVTAREARDIVTAVSTAAKAPNLARNIPQQIAEVGKAAVKGEKGSTAWVVKGSSATRKPDRDYNKTVGINKDTKVKKWINEK